MILSLNQLAANIHVLSAKLHGLHFNLKGTNFVTVHKYLEEKYSSLIEDYDTVAELLKIRNQFPVVKLSEQLAMAEIEEVESKDYSVEEALDLAIADFKLLIGQINNLLALEAVAEDKVVEDTLIGFLTEYQKTVWFLTASKRHS